MDESSCVRLYDHRVTWSRASVECQGKGGDLLDYVTTDKSWKFLSGKSLGYGCPQGETLKSMSAL